MPGPSHSGAYHPQSPISFNDYEPPFEDDDEFQDYAADSAHPPTANINAPDQNQAMVDVLMAQSSAGQPTHPTAAASVPTDLLLQSITPELVNRWQNANITVCYIIIYISYTNNNHEHRNPRRLAF